MPETVSTYAEVLIQKLLHVHALASMARSSGNSEYMDKAADWLPSIDDALKSMRAEIEQRRSHR